jgi:membrane-associated phospholipid phosphatase
MIFFLFLFFWIGFVESIAQQIDSVRIDFQVKQAIVPVSLAAAGLITQGRVSRYFQDEVQKAYPAFHSTADEYLIYAPGVFSLALGASGVKGRHPFKEQILLAILSSVASQVVTQGLKKIIAYPRPDGSTYDAFPSGHTTMAFTSATLLHEEYGHRSAWYSVGGYTVASTAGALRILNNRHWVSDVLMGAGVGIGATKGTYLVYPWAKSKLKKRK